jgi:alkanesulfonate monooxygenase SsuD/methylene tetrahydromethanopterin reductase-like flavin-dependent oxidoreductase (luciferase family)
MSDEMKFGLITLQSVPWKEELARWRRIEELGFDSVWLADHFVNYMDPEDPWFESWSLLSALAANTAKIRIGTLVTSIPLRNPAVLARQAMTVDHISGGRLELGLGAGAPGRQDPVYRMTGIEDWPWDERSARFREQVEIIDQCLRKAITSYDGEYYALEGTTIIPAPVQKPRPPITIGGGSKSLLKTAAQFADRWNYIGGEFGAPPEVIVANTKKRNAFLDTYCEGIGREPAEIVRSLLVWGAEANTVFASREDFTEVTERYRAIGMNELIFYYPFFNQAQIPMFERIAQEVIPDLRD